MMGRMPVTFTITDFWKRRLSAHDKGSGGPVGWQHVESGLETFVEAPLRLAPGFGDVDPKESPVILVSAPGAVGKSTLARQISFETGAMLLDLAKADPVGANTLIGGLAKTSLYQPFQNDNASLVVDGLDEARMRVTQGGFTAFIKDVVDLIGPNRKPIILFGRTGAIEETWLRLINEGIEAPVLEIEYYTSDQASEFVNLQLQDIHGGPNRHEPDNRAVDLILKKLREDLPEDENSFSGYAPVLMALAKQISTTENTQKLISRLKRGEEQVTLDKITSSILLREQEKLATLSFQNQTLKEKLYKPDEQIARLIMKLYGGDQLPEDPDMSAQDKQVYYDALENWAPEHPFLDGTGNQPSSAVFEGLLVSKALHKGLIFEMEFDHRISTNPFLAEFYISELNKSAHHPSQIQADHIGIVYASLRARLSQGETASLRIDGEMDEDHAEVEIIRENQNGKEPKVYYFSTINDGHFRFGPQIEDVDITASQSRVSVGHGGNEVVLIPPISIDTGELTFDSENIVVKASLRSNIRGINPGRVVSLQTRNPCSYSITHPPILHGEVRLEVSGLGFGVYPWRDFVIPPPDNHDPKLAEALRRLKRILKLFRSHGNDQLAKYRGAIEHRRRTKGSGQRVLDQLLEDRVVRIEGQMYYLDPTRLANVVGLSFHDIRSAGTTETTTEFLIRALNQS